MALINCPECNNQVSNKAEKCPKCAFPIKNKIIITKEKNEGCFLQTLNMGCMLIFGIIALIIILGMLA